MRLQVVVARILGHHSILMYHSTPSTPKTAGKAPAPSPHTAVQTEGTLSFHKVEDENAWGIAADPLKNCDGEND